MLKSHRLALSAAAIGVLALVTPAQASPHGVKVGSLTCNVASGWGFVFGSSKDLHCTFRQNRVGLGANVLVGGFDKSFALQPLSVSGDRGLNVAAGVGSITLSQTR